MARKGPVVDPMRRLTPNSAQCAAMLRALGDETRLRILESLFVKDKCVTDLGRKIRRGQPHVSHHLRILREAGLVEGLRDGKRVCYRIAPNVRRALKGTRSPTLEFGCCRISFPANSPAVTTR